MDWRVAGVTLSVVLPEMAPNVAKMLVEPSATPVATPLVRIDATAVVPEDQLTEEVMLRVEASE
jgi:hypothetical protein